MTKKDAPVFLLIILFILTIDFLSAISQGETIKLYKLLNTAESSNTITERSHLIGATNITRQDFNRLMQLRPFYFDIQINVSP